MKHTGALPCSQALWYRFVTDLGMLGAYVLLNWVNISDIHEIGWIRYRCHVIKQV